MIDGHSSACTGMHSHVRTHTRHPTKHHTAPQRNRHTHNCLTTVRRDLCGAADPISIPGAGVFWRIVATSSPQDAHKFTSFCGCFLCEQEFFQVEDVYLAVPAALQVFAKSKAEGKLYSALQPLCLLLGAQHAEGRRGLSTGQLSAIGFKKTNIRLAAICVQDLYRACKPLARH